MIILSKIDGEEFTLNCDMIETIHERPDTTIRLTNGQIYIVQQSMQEVIQKTIHYHREIFKEILGNRL